MEVKDSKDDALNSENYTIVILTRDCYLFNGLKLLIKALAPEFLSRTSMLFDVINVKELSTAITKTSLPGKKYILIADYDVRFCIDECQCDMRDIINKFSGIVIMSDNISIQGGGAFVLVRGNRLEDMRRNLLDIIYLITTGRIRPPENILSYLNEREVRILSLIIGGVELKHIASELNIHIKTLYAHRRKLYNKAGVNSLQQLYTRIPAFPIGV
ncbi:helix-turn-helix domain-containing protein [Raoultella ornithinolytica]|uniref:helix-turn-helix domain-containing protein n=1 Tax=Raoultella ornithinolytica TaxID=54291 RepID=UPI0013EF76D3|nr:LuxR C-terminal-related transcriptional regulator [Raoultella ornithinolytica]